MNPAPGGADALVRACLDNGLTFATAESLTAGLVCARVADVPGCSAMLRGGVVAYATDVKGSVLGLPAELLEHVVSEAVAVGLAEAASRVLDADLGVGTTGVAGPDPLDGQPPGSVWIAVFDRRQQHGVSRRLELAGGRQEVREASVRAALDLALEVVHNLH